MPIFHQNRTKRRKEWLTRLACTLTVFIFSVSVAAQEFVFNRLSQADGLASNFVHAVWQDRHGFLWIGSDNGLQRYDGRSFFSPNLNTRTTLPFTAVHQILSDGQRRMWLRCGNIVGVFDPGTFSFRAAVLNMPGEISVGGALTLHRDVHGRMYVLQKRNTVLYFDEKSFSFDKKFNPYKLPNGWAVEVTFEDSAKQRTWMAVNGGLACYDWKSGSLWHRKNNPQQIKILNDSLGQVYSFDIDKQRKYWITARENKPVFFCFDENKNAYTNDSAGLYRSEEKGYFEMRRIDLFSDSIYMAYGINAFMVSVNNRFEHMEDHTPAGSMQYENIEQIIEDREGSIWVASDNGLYTLTSDARKATRILLPKKTGTVFNAACQLPDGDILLNGFNQGLFRFDEHLTVQRPGIIKPNHPDINYQRSWTIFSNLADSTVWMGCQYGRLMIYDFKTGKLNYHHPKPFGRAILTKVVADADGNLWLGLSNGNILRWKQKSGMADESFELMCNVSMAITEIFLHSDGNLYAGTRGAGAFVISSATGKIVKRYSTSTTPAVNTNHIGDLCRVNDSTVWFTGDVIHIINTRTGALTNLTRYNDEMLGEPYIQVQDKFGDIWFVSTNGIYRYSPGSGYIQKFTQWEGLSTPNSSIAVFERRRLRNGSILLAGNLNAMIFDPANYRSTGKPGKVLISNFRLGATYLPVDSVLALKTIHLNRDENTLAISFAIPGFGRAKRNLYQYQLIGVDADWVNAGDVNEARYSLLPPGKYTFRVRAQNEEGAFSEETTSLRIVIHPPFWKTWWFISLVILIVAFGAYQVHRMRIRQLVRVQKVRARLARDLHDDMGSTLSTINILSTIAVDKVGENNQEVSNHLKNIGQSSSRVMEAMDDIVWSINPGNDNMQKIMARMREFASNTLEAKDIEFTFTTSEEVKDLKFDMESRRDIFLLFKEALNNIAKYAEAQTVTISLGLERRQFVMRIQDDGKGFDPAAPMKETRGNGLRNMKARAEAVRGSLSIVSQPGKGTTIELGVPLRGK